MASFIARKPCRFAGTDYRIGDRIPDGRVLDEKRGALTAMGVIAHAIDAQAVAPLRKEQGDARTGQPSAEDSAAARNNKKK